MQRICILISFEFESDISIVQFVKFTDIGTIRQESNHYINGRWIDKYMD